MIDNAERSFLFLLASSRLDGNTETLARRAAEQLPAGTEQRWLRLSELPLAPFVDRRHDGDGGYPQPEGNERVLLEATLAATDLVIASPLYWYSVSADAKLYLDHWAGWMRVPGYDFRPRMAGKTIWSVTALATAAEAADALVTTVRLSGEYLGMRWGGALLGSANRPGQIAEDDGALNRAKTFFAS
ncbi:NAD(P)H-dependent oxidoreductase [Kitasatospora sp. NBC_01287]|uniref:flavodoxin family protein n=1 Tax=Kitasatospora sp. NBC_01287 TaxID=2903573 RepID=UPI00224FBE40|nr:NAD(P)H-dependent oxidoreductase [Kitasatospora sp. NBC_01287]MCX4747326.1 NAD(P)H-dependent oxidoreductase [Kitasatospora sp. NBC_01287]